MNKPTIKAIITFIVISLTAISINASTLDKGKNVFVLNNVPTMTEVPSMIQSLEVATNTKFTLSYSDDNKAIYMAEKTVIVTENNDSGVEVKVLCGSRKPNKEYKKVVNAFQNNPALIAPIEE
ncbi:hypothetical protein [Flammeovirga sp. SJP92]|uniref:hypothetical protein n=1 Tax=Flammeovirga sp. SJP92 TaxID=1775430 RepID=UPI000786C1EA|nr:hypothetical protein [Flammeovirga sp. SJP92]KXX67606.1 hypothetical protein AVL50_26460 [Flammeovirga sp. SJP92]